MTAMLAHFVFCGNALWLYLADVQDLCDLRDTGFAGNYLSDELAYGARAYRPQVRAVLAYCEALNCGYTCALPIQRPKRGFLCYRSDIGPDEV